MAPQTDYGYTRALPGVRTDEAIRRITEALKNEGFGVLTTIDVKETMKKKLGIDFRDYVILGACNPNLAHRALTADLAIGLLLPCNVTVFDAGDGSGSVVQAVKPDAMMSVAKAPGLEEVAKEADQKLRRALEQA
jgi:uncharacterized protein (DUF302 family)